VRLFRRKRKPSEATVARIKAEQELAATKAETAKFKALGDSLRDLRERNHFAESIAHSFRGDT
jgi:hypothetical protein